MAAMAVSMSSWAVTTMTSVSGAESRSQLSRSSPLIPGIRMSVMISAGSASRRPSMAIAASALSAMATSCPSSVSWRRRVSRIDRSSSTTRMDAGFMRVGV